MADSEKYRDRKFCVVLYPEDPTHAACIEKLKSGGYNFAAILHDLDVWEDGDHKGDLKKAHWHVVLRYKNAVWNTAVAKDLGIEANYLEACKSVDASLLYLVHYGYEEKHQYDHEAVFGPLKNRLVVLLSDDDEGTRALGIADIIDASPGRIGYSELLRKAVAAGLYADLRRMGAFAVNLIREHNDDFDREVGIRQKFEFDRAKFAEYAVSHPETDFATWCLIMHSNRIYRDQFESSRLSKAARERLAKLEP